MNETEKVQQIIEEYNAKCSYLEELQQHLKKIIFTLHNIKSYDDKEKIVSALTNNGYVVGAELVKDKNTYISKGWRIDIYE